MKKIGTRTYRGVIITPVLGGWSYHTVGIDGAGNHYRYDFHTRSLEAAKDAIRAEILAGRYFAVEGTLVKKGA